jgi:exopolysaccharide biosynthesis polyprenyl glycosylphosphotransferase
MTDLVLGPEPGETAATDAAPELDSALAAPTVAASLLGKPALVAPQEPVRPWTRRYLLTLVAEDALCAVAAIAVGWAARFSFTSDADVNAYLIVSAAITLGWLLAVQLAGGYNLRAISSGPRQYYFTLKAAMNLAGSVAIVAYFSHMLIARTFLAIVIPVGAILQMLARFAVRRAVYARRSRGEWSRTILAVGNSESVRHLVQTTRRAPHIGLVVVGACVEDAPRGSELLPGVPVLAGIHDAAKVAEEVDVDVVAVAGSGLGPQRIRELGWELEGSGRNMVMAPELTEVAGPRVHVTPVEGLPLMWVDQPQFTGLPRWVKRAVDVTVSALLLTLGAPVLLLLGLLVRLTSAGPALYKSKRVGVSGELITVYKFRSMYADAEKHRGALLEMNEVPGGVLFKMRGDPRVTPIGRFLRKFSLDELPQLLNVLGGSMSLVGPRPPLPDEVEQYHTHVRRRLLVKPGMTGLWQVSGRSDLSWDESVRLDLYYVENWSLALDLAIIGRTIWAVLRSRGAY